MNHRYAIAIATVVGAVVLIVSTRFKIGAETAAAVTAFYAALVYFQLEEMRAQRQQLLDDRQADNERSRGKLQFLGKPEIRQNPNGRRVLVWEVCNEGQALARYSAPVLTHCFRATSPDCFQDHGPNVPAQLRWADATQPIVYGQPLSGPPPAPREEPLEDRHLTPLRPYCFEIAELRVITRPNGPGGRKLYCTSLVVQTTTPDLTPPLGPGTYDLDVSVFAENALPIAATITLVVRPDVENLENAGPPLRFSTRKLNVLGNENRVLASAREEKAAGSSAGRTE